MKNREDIKREIHTLKFVWKMAKGEHGKILTVVMMNILSGLIPAAVAFFIKNYLDAGLSSAGNVLNDENLILFLSLLISGIFIKMTAGIITGYAMANVRKNIEITCIGKFSRLPHSYISDCMDNRVIMSISMESKIILGLIPMVYNSFIKAPVTVTGFVILMMFVSPALTLISILLICTVIVGSLFFRKTIKHLTRTSYNRIGDLHQYFAEWLSGYRIFVASNAVKFIEKQLTGVSKEISVLSKRITKIGAIQSLSIEIISITLTILFVIIASENTFTGKIFNPGELLLFPAAILFIRGEILKIIAGYMQLASAESAAKRIMDIIEYPVVDTFGDNGFDEPVHSLTLKNVSFAYNNSTKKILDNADITFTRGKLHTIIGRSGAGKTTFINLCLRLRMPDSGAILYNGKEINAFSEENLMRKIGLVEQEPFIFEGTLAENIFFDRTPDTQYVLKLLKDLELEHLAKNESELFNTGIGQRGRMLSTGEKQRIAIIRALVKNVDVIFFDEATNNLDAWNTEKIIEYIKPIANDKLIICVSHDIMLIRKSDIVYELNNGKIKCTTT
jgi:ABC-type multidrug transport system fused ATPase/permease subunit